MAMTLEGTLAKMERALDELDAQVAFALDSMPPLPGVITDWNEYVRLVAAVLALVESAILNIDPPRVPDIDVESRRAWDFLKKAYGNRAPQVGFEIARTGKEGGVYGLIKTLADTVAQRYGSNQMGALVDMFWSKLTNEDRFKAMDHYLAKYGHLLPEELTECSAARIRFNFPQTLREHVHLMRRLRAVR